MFAALLSFALVQAPSFTVEPTVDGIRLVALQGGIPIELSNLKIGPVSDMLRNGSVAYAALVSGGVAVVDLRNSSAPAVVQRLVDGRVATQLLHQGDNVLVIVLRERETAAFSLTDPLHPVPIELTAPQASGAKKARGHVLGVRDGTVVIEGGSSAGFVEGEHVAILSHRLPSPSDAAAREAGLPKESTRTAVIELTQVEVDRSVGQLGRGDRAQAGDEVEATDQDRSSSLFLPSQAPFHWRLWLTLRPFFDTNTSSQSVGLLSDVMVAYYFDAIPLRLEAGIQPLGVAEGAQTNHFPLAAIADVAYSSTYFELGLGSGVFAIASGCTGDAIDCTDPDSVAGPLVVQTLRLGAIDGGNFTWISAVGVVRGRGFQVLSMRGEVNIPIVTRFTLYAGGGGGLGYFYTELGARAYVNGLGEPGTVILSWGIGGAGLSDTTEFLAGPALSFGVEVRL